MKTSLVTTLLLLFAVAESTEISKIIWDLQHLIYGWCEGKVGPQSGRFMGCITVAGFPFDYALFFQPCAAVTTLPQTFGLDLFSSFDFLCNNYGNLQMSMPLYWCMSTQMAVQPTATKILLEAKMKSKDCYYQAYGEKQKVKIFSTP